MAEALLSKEHFYLNAAQYNSGTADEDATIHVQDNTDILANSSDWLVHVTRFSCDTMKSLTYVEKDDTAVWEIRLVDNTAKVHEVFNFVLDDDYATPQSLVAAMNLRGRWISRRGVEYEVFRWQIDANGRFKLTSMSEEAIPMSHITYSGSESMNTLLGLERVTPFVSYQKSPTKVYADFADWFYESCLSRYDEDSMSYRMRRLTRNTVIHYLNGFQCNHTNVANTSVYITAPAHLATDIEYRTLRIVDKGLARTSANNESEAILPKGNSPVLCEWFGEYHGDTNFDTGFFASTSLLKYTEVYSPTAGHAEFYDIQTGLQKIAPCAFPQFWPVHEGKVHNGIAFDPSSTFVPLDSLYGYSFSGAGDVNDAGGSFVVTGLGMPGSDPRVFHFSNALEPYTVVGDDIWLEESYVMAGGGSTPAAWSTHQIESINVARDEVTVDMPMGTRLRASAMFPQADAICTNRRIPFQSRSMQWWGLQQIASVGDGWSLIFNQSTNGSPGDSLIFITELGIRLNEPGSLTITQRNWHPSGDYIAQANLAEAHEELMVSGTLPTLITNYGYNWVNANQWLSFRILIIKKAGDAIRWAIDKENLKLSSTTFSYDGIPYTGVIREPAVDISGLSYLPERYQQVYNKTMLQRQIQKTLDTIEQEFMFREFDRPCATTTIVEKITTELLQTMRFTHVVNRGGRFLETLWGISFLPADAPPTHSITHHIGGGIQARYILPNPWWTHNVWGHTYANELEFAEAHQYDKPHLQLARAVAWRQMNVGPGSCQYFHEASYGSGGAGDDNGALVWSDQSTGFLQMAPLICGVRPDINDRKSFVIWSPYRAIGDASRSETLVSPIRHENLVQNEMDPARSAVTCATYDQSTLGYALGSKEMNKVTLSDSAPTAIHGVDGDYVASELHSQIDLVFPFKQLVLTSDDLNQLPEKTQDSGGMKPILSSYTLPSMWPISVDKEGKPAGGESTPFGTVYFTESGARRFHHLTPVPGGLRQFTINAALTYKDDKRAVKRVVIPPGGSFNAQLLFIRKVNE